MQVYLGADHRGFQLKNEIIGWLQSRQIPFSDLGAYEYDVEDDYNDYARKVSAALLSDTEPGSFGILVCGSGEGMVMQANRFKGIRAAICNSAEKTAEARAHHDANILCISADEHLQNYPELITTFMDTKPSEEERYQRRRRKLDED